MAKEIVTKYVERQKTGWEDAREVMGAIFMFFAAVGLVLSAIAGGVAWFGLGDIEGRLRALEARPTNLLQYYTTCDKGVCTTYSYTNGQWVPTH
jgi:hypothetical protein